MHDPPSFNMPPNFRSLGKANKSKGARSSNQEEAETADEFLAVGVELEEAGEKWRAGDAAKSARFFLRAIETYERGLRRWPGSFDLAYNKARLQYSITQHPRLAAQIPLQPPLPSLLRTALESHRYALRLSQFNPDVLFNSAQVLSSLAEAVEEGKDGRDYASDWRDNERQEAVGLYDESLNLLRECQRLQERMFEDGEQTRREMEQAIDTVTASVDHDRDTTMDTYSSTRPSQPADAQEQWAAVEEPVTRSSLLDTAIALLETLTSLCHLYPDNGSAPYAGLLSLKHELCDQRIPLYLSEPCTEGLDKKHAEVQLATANFDAAWVEAEFRNESSVYYGNVEAYEDRLTAIFTPFSSADVDKTLPIYPVWQCDYAEALLSFNGALADVVSVSQSEDTLDKRWKALSKALDLLTTASKIDAPENDKARVNMRRGDVEMGRLRLAGMQAAKEGWSKAKGVLRGNAQTYYRGAARLAQNADLETMKEAVIRLLVASQGILDKASGIAGLETALRDAAAVNRVLVDMVDDELIGEDVAERIKGLTGR